MMKDRMIDPDPENLRELMKKVLDHEGKVECPYCSWTLFTEKEIEHHECGDNMSKHSKILATIAYYEFASEFRKRRRKQKKLFDFGEKTPLQKRRELFSTLGGNHD